MNCNSDDDDGVFSVLAKSCFSVSDDGGGEHPEQLRGPHLRRQRSGVTVEHLSSPEAL